MIFTIKQANFQLSSTINTQAELLDYAICSAVIHTAGTIVCVR